MVFYCSLGDREFPYISRTLFRFQGDLNSHIVWIVSNRVISNSSCPFTNSLVTVLSSLMLFFYAILLHLHIICLIASSRLPHNLHYYYYYYYYYFYYYYYYYYYYWMFKYQFWFYFPDGCVIVSSIRYPADVCVPRPVYVLWSE